MTKYFNFVTSRLDFKLHKCIIIATGHNAGLQSLGHKNQIDRINIRSVTVLSSSVCVVDSVRDLGVVIDSRSTMSDHVTALCRSGYYQLRQLRPVARALPEDLSPGVYVLSARLLQRATLQYHGQLVSASAVDTEATARLLTGTRRRDHISPVLSYLHWLPVKQRVVFKLTILVFKSLRAKPLRTSRMIAS